MRISAKISLKKLFNHKNHEIIGHILFILGLCIGCIGIAGLFAGILPFITALAGNYSTASPFSCGINCNGGYELYGHSEDYCYTTPDECYNTIDACVDGYDPTYEYVDNIIITDLNSANFSAGDTINIDAYLKCSSDVDQIAFAYNNGSGFRNINYTNCTLNDKLHKYYNFTLDNWGGNHTIRAIIAYKGLYPDFGNNLLCGGDEAPSPQWSDTDDVTFYVQGPSDTTPPSVTSPFPAEGTIYEKQEALQILVCVDAADDYGVSTVFANISWTSGNYLLELTDGPAYCAGFDNTSDVGIYNISFIANDTLGNINDSVTTYFIIEQTTNITLYEPTQGALFAYGPIPLNFTIGDGYEAEAAFYSLDDDENITITSGRVNVSFTQSDTDGIKGENTTDYANLSMSFKPSENMSVSRVSAKLKRNGFGVTNAQLQLRADDSGKPSDTILAFGNITTTSVNTTEYSFINLTLNTTANLTANTTYWLFLTPNSSAPDYYSWEASDDGAYANGNYSNNASLDLLFIVYDQYKFRTFLSGVEKGNHSIIVYANSSTENPITSPEINFSVDYTAPVLNNASYAPSTIEELDPGVTINFTGNITDDLAVAQVIIQYKNETESDFRNTTATYLSDIYNSTVTPDSEGIWTTRIQAWDASENYLISDNLTFDIAYEHNWSRTPESFNTTSALFDTNSTIGNITINNTGDSSISFNVSKTASVIPNIYFNNTPNSTVVNVNAGSYSKVNVTLTGQSTQSEQPISILIDAINSSAEPDYQYINFTFVSYVSGPYLTIDITEYDATVTQGQTRIGLTARITNVGNETANNVSANWSLPDGWTPKTNLTAEYSSLGIGQIAVFTRYMDVSSDATLGVQNITVYVNCSEGKSDSDQRSITVNSTSEGNEGEENIILGGGGGGGGIIPLEKVSNLSITLNALNDVLEIERGANKTLKGIIKNTGKTILEKANISLEGFPLTHYSISPAYLRELKPNASQAFELFISVPDYYGSGKQQIAFVVKAVAEGELKKFSKKLILVTVTEDKAQALQCFDEGEKKITELESKGIATTITRKKLEEARTYYDDQDYANAHNLCQEMLSNAALAAKLSEQMDSISKTYAGLSADLKKEIPELSELINLAQEAFESENYQLASDRAEQAELLIGMKEKEVQQTLSYKVSFIKEHLNQIIPALIIIIIIGIFVHSSTSLQAVKKRISALEERNANIQKRVKEVQRKYFVEKLLPLRIYDKEMNHYRTLLSETERKKIELEIRKLRIISGRTVRNLEAVRAEVEEKKKELQRKYFVDKAMDKRTYQKLSSGLDRTLLDIEKKIALRKGTKETKEKEK